MCDDAAACASRARELRALAAGDADKDLPLVTRAWLSDSIIAGALRDARAYTIDAPAPPRTPAAAPRVRHDAAPGLGPAGDAAAPERCDACGRPLQWSEIARCMRFLSDAPAALRALHLRYRADHPHNRELVAAFEELYEYEARPCASALGACCAALR